MFRGSSPIFDVPEFPPLRRVKPLPKRRRTSDLPPIDISQLTPHDLLNPDTTAEELVRSFSTSMALQSYYMPIFQTDHSSIQDDDVETTHHDATNNDYGGIEFQGHEGTGSGSGRGDADQYERDSADHLQQPGNTKKRKVPVANISSNGDAQSTTSGGEEDTADRLGPIGGIGGLVDTSFVDFAPALPSPPPIPPRKGKSTPATNASLQRKEMLRSRKRQLAAVLGALSHGDTLALDQALSSNYPFSKIKLGPNSKSGCGTIVRLSKRPIRRLSRRAQYSANAKSRSKFPACEFTFECPSATSERLIATKEEVAMLHQRFEAELSRQAAKAVEIARQPSGPTQRAKRGDRTLQRQRTAGLAKSDQNAAFIDPASPNAKVKGKKSKRSSLANASNPHHLRNYVPSRTSNSGQPLSQAAINSRNYFGPHPLRFLSAELPPRKKGPHQPVPLSIQLTPPEDEWICAFCEYSLFYGDEQSHRRAVRNRKKVLSRRRRARERAAAAANGKKPVTPVEASEPAVEETSSGFDRTSADSSAEGAKATVRGDRDRDKDGLGEQRDMIT